MNDLPPIHLINLDRSIKRLQRFKECNGHLKNVVRVPGADGSALDRKAMVRSGYITSDVLYSAGALGCAVSHLKLWDMAASQDRSITIFEDDIAVSYQFERRAREVLSVVPTDWDIIQWGYSLNPLFVWADFGISKVRLHCYGTNNYADTEALKKFQAEAGSSAPVRLLHSFGLMGYSISAKGARSALKYCLPLRKRLIQFPDAGVTIEDVGLDCALCGLYPTLKAFICIPQLIVHSDEHQSDRKTIDGEQVVAGGQADH